MRRFKHPLDNVRVASPCNADWDQMLGNDQARFCGQCNLNVYNLSSMSRTEAELLIGRTEGHLCVRYFRRADGSILTRDCPVGLRAIRRKMSYVARAVSSAVLTFVAGLGIYEMKPSSIDIPWSRPLMGAPIATTGETIMQPVIQDPSSSSPEVQGRLMIKRPRSKRAGWKR
jgi:hypothetical protein